MAASEDRVRSIVDLCNQIFLGFHLTPNDIQIKRFTTGMESDIFHVILSKKSNSTQESVVIKFFNATMSIAQRVRVTNVSLVTGLNNLAPKILLATDEALVFEFIKCRPLTEGDDRNEKIFERVAKQMARLHSLQVPIARNDRQEFFTNMVFDYFPNQRIEQEFYGEENRQVLRRLECTTLLEHNMADTIDYVKRCLASLAKPSWPVVFTHGDINHFNAVLLEEKDDIRFIDFDYSCYHYRALDIARYLSDYSSSELFGNTAAASDEVILRFIEHYIEENCCIYGNQYRDDPNNSPQLLLHECKIFILFAYVFNLVYTANKGIREPEYLRYTETRYRLMLQFKKRFEQDLLDSEKQRLENK